MNASSPDPLHGHDPADLLNAAALPTEDGADTPPLDRADLPTAEEIAAAFPELEILGLIGHGGMSAVFQARQPKLDRLVALKVLPKSLAATPGFTERFTREGRIIARLGHPHIVAVHDFGTSGGFAYLVMEYVDGVNLRQAMRAGRFTPEQALAIVPGICDALQFAHSRGVLHRDIKPENILLDASGKVKIADFGIAKLLDEQGGDAMLLTRSGAKLGTAPYMAPEQIEQPASVDHRADIYSLGVVLYEMLTGELPLGRFAAPSELSEVGGKMDEIVFRSLEKERSRRQQSVSEFKTQVERAGDAPMASRVSAKRLGEPFEYRSKRRLCGLPLLHVVAGSDPETGKPREAHGFFAVGGRARGVFAFGGVARGWVAFGGVAMGLVAFGGLGIGLISFGGLALGLLLAYGGLGFGTFALGGLAAGYHAVGGMALGWHGIGGMVLAHQGYGGMVRAAVVAEELRAMPPLTQSLDAMKGWGSFLFLLWLPVSAFVQSAQSWGRGQAALEAGSPADHRVSKRIFWAVPAVSLIGVVWIGLMRVLLDIVQPSLETGEPFIPWVIVPSGIAFIGLLIFMLALPMWLRMVPVNQLYGLRLPSTMVSDERWYAANTYAGKVFLLWSLAILGAGLAGFFQLPRHQDSYHWAVLALSLFSAVSVLVSIHSWLRHHPVNGPETRPSWLAKSAGNVVIAVVVAFFIRSFILEAYRVPDSFETGVAKGSHWIACVEQAGTDGLVLKRGGRPDAFPVTWDKIIGKLIFSHFTPDTMVQP